MNKFRNIKGSQKLLVKVTGVLFITRADEAMGKALLAGLEELDNLRSAELKPVGLTGVWEGKEIQINFVEKN